jgi:hypothetical protein
MHTQVFTSKIRMGFDVRNSTFLSSPTTKGRYLNLAHVRTQEDLASTPVFEHFAEARRGHYRGGICSCQPGTYLTRRNLHRLFYCKSQLSITRLYRSNDGVLACLAYLLSDYTLSCCADLVIGPRTAFELLLRRISAVSPKHAQRKDRL